MYYRKFTIYKLHFFFFAKRKGESKSVQTEKTGVARNSRKSCVWKETDLVCFTKYNIGISIAIYEYITKFITENTRLKKGECPNAGEEGRGSSKQEAIK